MIPALFESDIKLMHVVYLTTSQQGWNIDQPLTAMSVQPHSVSLPVRTNVWELAFYTTSKLQLKLLDLKWFVFQRHSGPTAPEHGPQRGAVPELLSVRLRRLDRASRHSRNQLPSQRVQYPERRAGDRTQGSVTSTSRNHHEQYVCVGFF